MEIKVCIHHLLRFVGIRMSWLLFKPCCWSLSLSLLQNLMYLSLCFLIVIFLLPPEHLIIKNLIPPASNCFLILYLLMEYFGVELHQHQLFQLANKRKVAFPQNIPRYQHSNQRIMLYLNQLLHQIHLLCYNAVLQQHHIILTVRLAAELLP